MSAAPIFLLASERSGSNLLRILLGNHSQVHAPVAPHFFDAFMPLARHYGDLRRGASMLRLLEDMLGYVQHPFHAWGLQASADDLLQRYGPTSLLGACDALWRAMAAQQGKATFMSKDNHLFNYAFEIRSHWPQAKFLYLHRDPRDQCASWVSTPFHLKTVEDIARRWEREQRRCLVLHDAHGFELCFISYEDLITDTPAVMARVLAFCGLPVETACFQTDSAKVPEAGRIKLWANLDKPILRENKRKYAKVLSAEQIRQVETIAAPLMRRLGYPTDTPADWRPGVLYPLAYRLEWRRMERRSRELKDEELRLLVEKLAYLEALKRRLSGAAAQ